METPIRFRNREGKYLYGMLFSPDAAKARKGQGVLISIDSLKSRIGTYRFNTLLARELASSGYHVMYFDPAGVGDSEGRMEDRHIAEHFRDIQTGRYVPDTIDAISYFCSECKIDKLAAVGLCGGAITVHLAASESRRVSCLALLSLPVLVDELRIGQAEEEALDTVTSEGQALNIIWHQFVKVFDAETWRKVFANKIAWHENVVLLAHTFKLLARQGMRKLASRVGQKSPSPHGYPVSKHPRFNRKFQAAFFENMEAGVRTLFVFGEYDYVRWNFKSEFEEIILTPGNPFEEYYEIHTIKGANHIFADPTSRNELTALIKKWLARSLLEK